MQHLLLPELVVALRVAVAGLVDVGMQRSPNRGVGRVALVAVAGLVDVGMQRLTWMPSTAALPAVAVAGLVDVGMQLPKSTKTAYLESISNIGEDEMLLPRNPLALTRRLVSLAPSLGKTAGASSGRRFFGSSLRRPCSFLYFLTELR